MVLLFATSKNYDNIIICKKIVKKYDNIIICKKIGDVVLSLRSIKERCFLTHLVCC